MNIANLGKALAGQAIEGTKNTVLAAMNPDPPKPAKPEPAPTDVGGVILGQIQAMQRPLQSDQELHVLYRAGEEMLRVFEIFVPSPNVLVFAGVDYQGNVTRVIAPVHTARVVCKIMKVSPGTNAVRVNILTPKPRQEPAA